MDWLDFAKPTQLKLIFFIILFFIFPIPVPVGFGWIPLGGLTLISLPDVFGDYLAFLIVLPYLVSCGIYYILKKKQIV